MAMSPQNWFIWEYSKEGLNNRNYGTSIQDGRKSWSTPTPFALDTHTPCHHFWLFLMCLSWLSFLFTCPSICTICSNLSVNSELFVTSTQAKYSGSFYRQINLVPSSLILWSMGSNLPVCICPLLMLIAKGCYVNHKEYYWPNISSHVHIGLCHQICNIFFARYMSN